MVGNDYEMSYQRKDFLMECAVGCLVGLVLFLALETLGVSVRGALFIAFLAFFTVILFGGIIIRSWRVKESNQIVAEMKKDLTREQYDILWSGKIDVLFADEVEAIKELFACSKEVINTAQRFGISEECHEEYVNILIAPRIAIRDEIASGESNKRSLHTGEYSLIGRLRHATQNLQDFDWALASRPYILPKEKPLV